MRKLLILTCIPFLLYSHPTRLGVRGFNNLISPLNNEAGYMNIITDGYGSMGGEEDLDFWGTADLGLGMGFAFTDWLSMNLFSRYMVDALDSIGISNYLSHGMGDLNIGFKFTPSLLLKEEEGGFDVGLYSYISIPIGTEPKKSFPDTNFYFSIGQGGMYRYFTTGNIDYGGKLLLSYTTRTHIPIEIIGNIGYFTHSKKRGGDKLSYGLGMGFLYKNFTPYIEISGWERDRLSPRVLYLTPGVKIGDKNKTSVNLSLNFRVYGDIDQKTVMDSVAYLSTGERTTPSWSFNISYIRGFSIVVPTLQPPSPVISGIVLDKKSRAPLSAVLSLPDTVIETDITGKYLIEVESGSFIMRAEKEGYIPVDRSITVKPGQDISITFELERVHILGAEIAGRVKDRVTDLPIAVEVSFPDTEIEPFITDETGTFKVDVSPGTYIIKITADGYIPYATPISVKDGETLLKDFYLLKEDEPVVTVIAGKVMDRVTGVPIAVEISFRDTEIEPYVTDETGVFKLDVSPGTYIIKITADGYIPYATPISVKDGETLLKDFYLLKEDETITIRGIHFATGSAEIEPAYYPILDDGLKLLQEYPDIKIEIRGHTDNVGSADKNLDLSQARAESVMNYLIGMGIDPRRLTAAGYGEAIPVADNETERGRALNRRIEFRIIGE